MPSHLAAPFASALAQTPQWFVCGLEREGLRATPHASLATTPHPRALGSKLTHPSLTTDFGEAQLEFITKPHPTTEDALGELAQLHAWVWLHLDKANEILWPYSMPCALPQHNEDIAIADFGQCNAAQLKYTYRLGLTHRYGHSMQTVSGVHLNLSFTEPFLNRLAANENTAPTQQWRNQRYFGLMRNYRRLCFVVNYLFGASPVIDGSFARLSRTIDLDNFATIGPASGQGQDEQALVGTHATSLRQSNIGYVAPQQRGMSLCFNQLDTYVSTINKQITTPYPSFAALGLLDAQGKHKQLGTGLFQIENEYYSPLRPKHPVQSKQRPLLALSENGIAYIEIRNLDLNPFAPCGIDQTTLDFMALLFLWCFISPSPTLLPHECQYLETNDLQSATRGRDKATTAMFNGTELPLSQAVDIVLEQLSQLAEELSTIGHPRYAAAVAQIRGAPLLSQRVENACTETTLRTFCTRQAQQLKSCLPTLTQKTIDHYDTIAAQSLREFERLEAAHAANPQPFSHYLSDYMQGKLT